MKILSIIILGLSFFSLAEAKGKAAAGAGASCQQSLNDAFNACTLQGDKVTNGELKKKVTALKTRNDKMSSETQKVSTQLKDKKTGTTTGTTATSDLLGKMKDFNKETGEVCQAAKQLCRTSCKQPADAPMLAQCEKISAQELSAQGENAANMLPGAQQTAAGTQPGGVGDNGGGQQPGAGQQGAGQQQPQQAAGGASGLGGLGAGIGGIFSGLKDMLPMFMMMSMMEKMNKGNGQPAAAPASGSQTRYVKNPQQVNPGLAGGVPSQSPVETAPQGRTIAAVDEGMIQAVKQSAAIQDLRGRNLLGAVRSRVLKMIRNHELEQASFEINELLSGNSEEARLAQTELQPALDAKLQELGLPSGDLGISMVNEHLSPGRDSNVLVGY